MKNKLLKLFTPEKQKSDFTKATLLILTGLSISVPAYSLTAYTPDSESTVSSSDTDDFRLEPNTKRETMKKNLSGDARLRNEIIAPLNLDLPEKKGQLRISISEFTSYGEVKLNGKNASDYSGNLTSQQFQTSTSLGYLTGNNISLTGYLKYQQSNTDFSTNETASYTKSSSSNTDSGIENPALAIGYLVESNIVNQFFSVEGNYPFQSRDTKSGYLKITKHDSQASAPEAKFGYTIYTPKDSFIFGTKLSLSNKFADSHKDTSTSNLGQVSTYEVNSKNSISESISVFLELPKIYHLNFTLGYSQFEPEHSESKNLATGITTDETSDGSKAITAAASAKFKLSEATRLLGVAGFSYLQQNDSTYVKIDPAFIYAAGAGLEVLF